MMLHHNFPASSNYGRHHYVRPYYCAASLYAASLCAALLLCGIIIVGIIDAMKKLVEDYGSNSDLI